MDIKLDDIEAGLLIMAIDDEVLLIEEWMEAEGRDGAYYNRETIADLEAIRDKLDKVE